MKTIFALLPFLTPSVQAATLSFTSSSGFAIPDGSSSGAIDQIVIDGIPEAILSVTLDLEISSLNEAFLGDLYLYLSDGTNLSVLLNRPGRTSSNTIGYDDDQLVSITFDDTATNDIHSYRSVVTGSETIALSQELTGTWLPDGRLRDPSVVVESDARVADLSLFNGSSADGVYTLFAADLSTGFEHQIDSWTLNIETVPEPSTLFLSFFIFPALLVRKRS